MQTDHDRVDAAFNAARSRGIAAAKGSTRAAEDRDPLFGARALAFIVGHVRAKGKVSGESTTLAAEKQGIQPKDARAFGSIYAMAVRKGYIQVVGYCPRVRGNGTFGGRLYAPGANTDSVDFPN